MRTTTTAFLRRVMCFFFHSILPWWSCNNNAVREKRYYHVHKGQAANFFWWPGKKCLEAPRFCDGARRRKCTVKTGDDRLGGKLTLQTFLMGSILMGKKSAALLCIAWEKTVLLSSAREVDKKLEPESSSSCTWWIRYCKCNIQSRGENKWNWLSHETKEKKRCTLVFASDCLLLFLCDDDQTHPAGFHEMKPIWEQMRA